MSKIFIFKRLKENVRVSMINLACFFMIALLTGACAGEHKKQTSPYVVALDQIRAKGESENGVTNDDKEKICRTIVYTGSRLKHKLCATKEEWAKIDNKNRNKADEFEREVSKDDGVNIGSVEDAMGGKSGGMPR